MIDREFFFELKKVLISCALCNGLATRRVTDNKHKTHFGFYCDKCTPRFSQPKEEDINQTNLVRKYRICD